jgi:nicotinamidase-related amidase
MSTANPSELRLDPAHTGLLLVDWQERLAAAMPASERDHRQNVGHLIFLAGALGLPVVVTEQYPKGLGATLPALAETLPEGTPVLAKTTFSAWGDAAARSAIEATGRRTWLVVGMETHVCVYQTVRDLKAAGLAVQVPADAVLSRTEENWKAGLALCAAAGAIITVTEAALFDLLGEAQGETFKAISRRIR